MVCILKQDKKHLNDFGFYLTNWNLDKFINLRQFEDAQIVDHIPMTLTRILLKLCSRNNTTRNKDDLDEVYL